MKKKIAIIAAILIIVPVLVYFLFPAPFYRMAIYAGRSAAGLTEKTVQVDDHRIVYLEGGRGETVLLVHGFGAEKDNWVLFAKYLTPIYRVVIPDLAGFGEISRIPEASYDIMSQAARLDRFTGQTAPGDARADPVCREEGIHGPTAARFAPAEFVGTGRARGDGLGRVARAIRAREVEEVDQGQLDCGADGRAHRAGEGAGVARDLTDDRLDRLVGDRRHRGAEPVVGVVVEPAGGMRGHGGLESHVAREPRRGR